MLLNQIQEGIWLELKTNDGTKPTLCIINEQSRLYLAVYTNTNAGKPCDFAISFEQDCINLQVRKGDQTKIIDLFDLVNKYAISNPTNG